MLGFTLVRTLDYDRLVREKTVAEAIIADERRENTALRERLIGFEGQRASACTMRDMLVTRVNVLEEECAVLKHKLTGLPQIAAKIEKGSPIASSAMGAQVDLFEDVGDEKAQDLKDRGLLHADDAPPLFPSAADLTKHLS
jgi:hypothetical protein